MATYTNTFGGIVQVGDIIFGPNEVKQLYNYIDLNKDTTGYISFTSHVPFTNPSNWVHSPTSGDATITLVSWENTDGIEIWNGSTQLITVFLTSTDNTPGLRVPPSTVREIWGFRGGVKTLALTYGGAVTAGQCYITEFKSREFSKLRNMA